jgi:hypothetical protein
MRQIVKITRRRAGLHRGLGVAAIGASGNPTPFEMVLDVLIASLPAVMTDDHCGGSATVYHVKSITS